MTTPDTTAAPARTPIPVTRTSDGQPWTCDCGHTNTADTSQCTGCTRSWGTTQPAPAPTAA